MRAKRVYVCAGGCVYVSKFQIPNLNKQVVKQNAGNSVLSIFILFVFFFVGLVLNIHELQAIDIRALEMIYVYIYI